MNRRLYGISLHMIYNLLNSRWIKIIVVQCRR